MYDIALLRPCNAPIHDLLPATVLTDQITGITTATTSRWGFPIHSKKDSNHLTSTASLDDHPFYARLLGPSKKSLPEAMEKISQAITEHLLLVCTDISFNPDDSKGAHE
jgi:hypothetical protein